MQQSYVFYNNNSEAPDPGGTITFFYDDDNQAILSLLVDVWGRNSDQSPSVIHVSLNSQNPLVNLELDFIANPDGSEKTSTFSSFPENMPPWYTMTTGRYGNQILDTDSSPLEIWCGQNAGRARQVGE